MDCTGATVHLSLTPAQERRARDLKVARIISKPETSGLDVLGYFSHALYHASLDLSYPSFHALDRCTTVLFCHALFMFLSPFLQRYIVFPSFTSAYLAPKVPLSWQLQCTGILGKCSCLARGQQQTHKQRAALPKESLREETSSTSKHRISDNCQAKHRQRRRRSVHLISSQTTPSRTHAQKSLTQFSGIHCLRSARPQTRLSPLAPCILLMAEVFANVFRS